VEGLPYIEGMAAATTYREIQDGILDLLSKSDSTTRNRVKKWINLGQNDFVLRELWPFREVTGTLSLVQGTQEYSLASNFPDLDQQNIISVSLQGANQRKLVYWPFNQLRADKPDFDYDAQAVPERYYLRAGNIGFWPVPSGAYTVLIDHYKVATELSDDADTSILPVGYREALIHYGLALEHDYNTDPDLAQKAMNRYEDILTSARQNLLAQPVDSGAFQILGPADFRNHTGLPGEVR
jgi:hypothetical protein